ncbi:hypothetical protein [Oceanobacillus sp. 1P07AA]|uniref:hypothetical protein n=1 Tax=Oceanobacillus sp. 1P07AA TaxID=3132293 RepID=UPI0039A5A940
MIRISKEKTKLIINEINYWKEHRLLPERYCDYLLALYTKGGELEVDDGKRKKLRIAFVYFSLILVMLVVVSTLFIFYNNSVLQFLILIFGFMLSGIGIIIFRPNHQPLSFVGWISFLLFLLQLSILLCQIYFDALIVIAMAGIQFFLWFIIGYLRKDTILRMVGLIALLSMLIYVVFLNFL